MVTSPITIGDTDSISFEGESGSLDVELTFPEGVPGRRPEVAVCEDGPNQLISSRRPDDLPAFKETILETLSR